MIKLLNLIGRMFKKLARLVGIGREEMVLEEVIGKEKEELLELIHAWEKNNKKKNEKEE